MFLMQVISLGVCFCFQLEDILNALTKNSLSMEENCCEGAL